MKVIVIGAGVIGLSAALMAQARGLSVTVVDREGPAAGASAGNAGAFAFTDILPLASPGILRKAPKWLLDPLGPLTIPPAYALQIAPWLYRFWRACSPRRVAASTTAQTALMDLSRAELEPFLAATGTLGMLRKDGNLQVYETRSRVPRLAARLGGPHRARDRVPPHDRRGDGRVATRTFAPFHAWHLHPRLVVHCRPEGLCACAGRPVPGPGRHDRAGRGHGPARRRTAEVYIQTNGEPLTADKVVLCAGAFSHRIAATLGEKIPLETERGYNTTLPPDALDLRCQVTFGGHGFVVSRLSTGIRVGGAVELGGLSLPPNYKRSEAMLRKAKAFLPGLKTEGGTQWMGFRPSLPDSLPAIGRSQGLPHTLSMHSATAILA